jgi:alpha-L-fucosidase
MVKDGMTPDTQWFRDARYGLIIHYGLYSLLGRGEWVMNREQIPAVEYARLADRFTAEAFDADALLRRARDWGMRYAVLTTKHHDGFCLYDSHLTGFTSVHSAAKRDLVAEFVGACRKYGLRVGLYHTLNDLSANPNAVDALERPAECYQRFIDFVHGQIREIMTQYGPVDIMWYDGWWPFDGKGWQAEKLNAMVRSLQPGILVNSRCGIPGDFVTPEGHISVSTGMWESCMTLNNNWGYHRGDHNWKSPKTVAGLLQEAASGAGNLLLNVGPKGDGSIPEESLAVFDRVGEWLRVNGEAVYNSEWFRFNLRERGNERSDWTHHGGFTARGNRFYLHVHSWPGPELVISGLECKVTDVTLLRNGRSYPFRQRAGVLIVSGLPEDLDTEMPAVIRFTTQDTPCIYRTGGHRNPKAPHCRYDPMPSEISS